MAVEHAHAHAITKPWGITDLRPWSHVRHGDCPIGEIWYERPNEAAIEPSLLLKMLFTSQPLSIQVHPDDAYARAIGLPNGKTEAWYVLSASPESKIAIGLKQRVSPQQLRAAIDAGSILDLVHWQTVSQDNIIFVPAGTIHAIGAGVVIAEIQQRSDATFRLFDFGRQRELHIDRAIAVADAGPADCLVTPIRITDARTLLISNTHFVFEKVNLAPGTAWCMETDREAWFLVLSGDACVGSFDVGSGDAIFVQSDRVNVDPGQNGMVGLAAYTGGEPLPRLLQRVERQLRVPPLIQARPPPKIKRRETTQ